jgi:Na+-transporting NADH:ubiquinone oxidoreductase subunit NqrB
MTRRPLPSARARWAHRIGAAWLFASEAVALAVAIGALWIIFEIIQLWTQP